MRLPAPGDTLTNAQARRIALAAQGFNDRPPATPTLRTLGRTLTRTGVLQVDSVNVLQRAHYLPLYSRMGPYDLDLVRRASEPARAQDRQMVEYWAHVQAFMPVDLWPAMVARRRHHRERRAKWSTPVDQGLLDSVKGAVAELGAVTATELEAARGRSADRERGHWGWNWSESRTALDALFASGEVAIAGRTAQFEPRYDIADRVIPARYLECPELSDLEANTELVRRAARSHGVGTAAHLADYYRMSANETRDGIAVLVEAGELTPVTVQGWRRPGYLWSEAAQPRAITTATLLSPFDPVVWHRERAESLFDFHYRIEIYTPAAKRKYGYYVLPFLLGDQLVARVDLKADRARGVLSVKDAHAEVGAPDESVEALRIELDRVARWLNLGVVEVDRSTSRGELAALLSSDR